MCRKKNKYIKIAVLLLFSGLLIILWCNFKIIIVDGVSMQPTYSHSQVLIAKRTSSIDKNMIVVFKESGTLNIKRVIGIAGDFIRLENGEIYVNDVLIKPYTYNGEDIFVYLEHDEFFVIGDNYQNSYDSRNYGAISIEQIYGVII